MWETEAGGLQSLSGYRVNSRVSCANYQDSDLNSKKGLGAECGSVVEGLTCM